MTWRGTYSRANAFLKCDNLDVPKWIPFYHLIDRMRTNGQMTPMQYQVSGRCLKSMMLSPSAGTRVLALTMLEAICSAHTVPP